MQFFDTKKMQTNFSKRGKQMPPSVSRTRPTSRRSGTTTKQGTIFDLDDLGYIDFGKDDGIKLTLYGRSGTGKTTFWSSFPKPILAILSSGGKNPGELRSIDTADNRKTIRPIALESSLQVRSIVNAVEKNSKKFKTVVLDHATGLQDLVLKEILGLDELPAQLSWGLATQQQYGQCTLQCKEAFRALLSLDCNVVIVAQERNFNDDSSSELIAPSVGAALTPSLTQWLNQASDYICQTFIRQKEKIEKVKIAGKVKETRKKVKGVDYCMRTAPDPVYITKFRLPKGHLLPDVIVDPDYDKFMKTIRGE